MKAAKESFDREYDQQLARAVASGDYPEKAPTKFKRAYIIFTEDMRNALANTADARLTAAQREQFSGMSMTEKSKAFGELWKTVTDAEKARYAGLEKEAELAYTAEFYDYNVRVLERQIAKAEREGHDAKDHRERLVEVQLKPPTAEARAAQPKYYGANASASASATASVAPAATAEKVKKPKKEKAAAAAESTEGAAATVVLTTEQPAAAEKTKKSKKATAAASS